MPCKNVVIVKHHDVLERVVFQPTIRGTKPVTELACKRTAKRQGIRAAKHFLEELFPKGLRRSVRRERGGRHADKEHGGRFSEFIQQRSISGFGIPNSQLRTGWISRRHAF